MTRLYLIAINNRVHCMRDAIVGFIAPVAAILTSRISSDYSKEPISITVVEL